MSEKISCHIVKDLLPLEADGLTGEETSRDIKAHLETCEDCRKVYEAMVNAGQGIHPEQKEQETKQIDYLKKVRRRGKRAAIIVGCIALMILAAFFLRFFVAGSVERDAAISVDVTDGKHITANVTMSGSATAVSKVSFAEKDGVVTITAYSSLVGIRRDPSRTAEYTAASEVKQVVDAAGRVLWEDGMPIDSWIGKMFTNKVKYVGDAPAVTRLLSSVWFPGLDVPLGTGGIELKTASEPYGVIINIGRSDIKFSDNGLITLTVNVKKHACLMLALIDNLGYVEYRIETDRRSSDNEYLVITDTISADEALETAKGLAVSLPAGDDAVKTVLAAESIKEFAKSASSLRQLVDVLRNGTLKDVEISW